MDYQELEDEQVRKQLGFCACLGKWFVWIVNIILFIVGVAEIGAGIYAMNDNTTTWTGSDLPKFAMVMGAIVACIAFLGCCGAAKENRCLLWSYAFILFWIILAQTSGLTVCAIGSSYTEEFLSECWTKLSDTDQSKIEDAYKCCSFNGNDEDPVPSDKDAYDVCVREHPAWTDSCWEKAHTDVENNIKTISIAVAVVLGAQIIFLFVTMALITGITAISVYRKVSYVFGGQNVGV